MSRALLNRPDYSELLSKSCFSFLWGASHPQELVRTAHHYGYKHLALVDRNGFYGMVRAYEMASKLDLPLIVGTEIEVESSALCLIAKNIQGYRKICRLLSSGFKDRPKADPAFYRKDLREWVDAENMHILLAPRQFPNPSLLSFLRELSPIHQFVTKRFQPDADQKMRLWLQSLSKDIPRVWTWDAQFHHKSRFELYEVMQGIRENTPLSKKLPSFNAESYLKPLSALKAYQVPSEWIKQGHLLAESCSFSPKEIRYHYPKEWLPEGKNSYEFLKELCELGIKKRYPQGTPRGVYKQLQYELQLVKELQYEDYFLTVWDIVSFARSQKILCQGRGSAANSVICYLLEVTSIDPVQMNLLFERFISKERDEAPDIDVDFEHERREEVIQYIYQKYGRHRAGMVATLITYRTKSAIRDIGRILELDSNKIDEMSHRSRWRENVLEIESEDPKLKRVLRLAKQLKGFPRHLGLHTGGMIICQDRLDEISPIEPATKVGRSLVQWDKYDVEKLGLLKIDVLSLGMLTCIRKSLELLKEHGIADMELHEIPQNDPKTYDMISQSRTVGVFQIESRAQMSMLPRLRPRCFYDLVIEVAIIRPGPIQGGMVHPYLRRRMGLEKVQYAHPKLKPILEKTLGVPIFQEQVMKIAIEVAGFSPGEADELRRAMGAWKKRGDLTKYAQDLKNRLLAKGIAQEFTDRICQQILGFGEYGFPESHAASFALLTYASSYLKAHHPAAFLCGLLNSMPMGFYSLHVLTSDFMREGVKIRGVSTQYSKWDHQVEKTSGGDWALRLGFRVVKGLSKDHVEDFVAKRELSDEIDLYIFNEDERAAIRMMTEENRRAAYWKALAPQAKPLDSKEEKTPNFKQPNPFASMLLDFEFMETTLQTHPAQLLREKYWSYKIPTHKLTKAEDFKKRRPNQNILCFGIIQIVQSPPTAKGMFFITLEDETGFINLVFRPQVFRKYKALIQSQWALLVSGQLQSLDGYASVLVHQVIPMAPQEAQLFDLHSRRPEESIESQQKQELSQQVIKPRLFNGW